MQLKTISASSLTTFEECPARWHAENVLRTPRVGGPGPAGIGTACHEALEKWVKAVYLDKLAPESWDLLIAFYEEAFQVVFNTADQTGPEYKDGLEMLKNWYERTDLEGVDIISCETKSFIMIKTSEGEKKYNYIWDRCDRLTEGGKKIIRVVDYKSIRANLSPEDLREKIQAKMYGLAAAIQFKDEEPDEIWVMFDLLRYGTVEVKFTREQNLETWKYMKKTANMIIDMPDIHIREQLGPGCSFCVRKTTCSSLRKNVAGGGVMSIMSDNNELAKARLELEGVMKGAKYGLEEIDNIMLAKAKADDEIESETEDYKIKFTSRVSRYVDTEEVLEIVGPEIFQQIGTVNVGAVEKLLKGTELTPAKKSLLRGAFKKKYGELTPKITKKT